MNMMPNYVKEIVVAEGNRIDLERELHFLFRESNLDLIIRQEAAAAHKETAGPPHVPFMMREERDRIVARLRESVSSWWSPS